MIKNRSDVIALLIERGARLDIINRDNKSPFDLAVDSRCKSLLQYKSKYKLTYFSNISELFII